MAHFVKEGSGDLSAGELRALRQIYREHKVRVEDVGLQGEQRAAAYLSAAGYEVVERRYSGSGGEVDLIVRREGAYAFVDVKTRADASSYAPEDRVNMKKRSRLARAARHYLHSKGLEVDCRFDVIAVTLGPGDGQVEHWPDAFDA
jgi:putative endonuclease